MGATDGKHGAESANRRNRPDEPAAPIGVFAVSVSVSWWQKRRHAEKAPICGEISDPARKGARRRSRPDETSPALQR
ncbi:hypothetical protein CO709_18090 [Burkholderia thailandensis]|nr:hypothetical protein CO709_18090 [Burkholderia thailandensis]